MDDTTRQAKPVDPAAAQLAARLEVFSVWGVGLLTLIAMFFSGWGMWHTIADKFPQIAATPALIIPVFLIFDLAGVLCALISVVCLLRHQVRGIAYPGVWAFAGLSGVMSASDGSNGTERSIRFLVPAIAAIFFEILLALKRKHLTNKAGWTDKILQPLRVLLGAARSDEEIRRGRAARKLALQAHAMHQLDPTRDRKRRAPAERKYLAAVAVAIERHAVATDRKLIEDIRVNLAAMHGAISGTTAEAVSDASPWTRPEVPPVAQPGSRPAVLPLPPFRPEVRGGSGSTTPALPPRKFHPEARAEAEALPPGSGSYFRPEVQTGSRAEAEAEATSGPVLPPGSRGGTSAASASGSGSSFRPEVPVQPGSHFRPEVVRPAAATSAPEPIRATVAPAPRKRVTAAISAQAHSTGKVRGTREDMLALLAAEPGLSGVQLAQQLGVSDRTIRTWRNNAGSDAA